LCGVDRGEMREEGGEGERVEREREWREKEWRARGRREDRCH
jgi:hypothetical protein